MNSLEDMNIGPTEAFKECVSYRVNEIVSLRPGLNRGELYAKIVILTGAVRQYDDARTF